MATASANGLKLGYLKVVTLAPGSFAGGLLVVDGRGVPQDFRYTDPVMPSKVQQILYGKSLERHVRQDVIYRHLADKIEQKPGLLLVDDEMLLGLGGSIPTLLVVETRLSPLHEVGQLQAVSETEFLLQVRETGSPVRFKLGKPEAGLPEKVAEALLEAARLGLDLTDPFGRIRSALDELCAPDSDRP